MQQDTFLALIKQHRKSDKATFEQLKEFCRAYPYCQPARILLAKSMMDFEKESFEENVNLASAYAIDRKKFQAFISGKKPSALKAGPEKETHPSKKALREPLTTPNAPGEEKTLHSQKSGNGFWPQWLLRFFSSGNHAPVEKKPEAAIPEPVKEKTLVENVSLFDVSEKQNPVKSSHMELIERFLKEEPRIQAKKEGVSTENMAEKSTAEAPDLATETLAEVYLKQGKTERALDIYKKLSLKFPEKSSYFAKKINAINNETK